MSKQKQPKQNQPASSTHTLYSVGQGPTSIQGVEAHNLPDKGRGPIETDPAKELSRKTPAQTGGTLNGDVGLRANPNSADAKDHGHRKHN